MPVVISGTNGVSGVDGTASNPSYEGTDSNTGIFFPAADTIAFAEGGTEVARFDSSGNFGIGTSSPSSKLQVKSAGPIIRLETTAARGSGSNYLQYIDPTGDKGYVGYISGSSDDFAIYNALSANTTFATGGTERARITSGGALLVGTTSAASAEILGAVKSVSNSWVVRAENSSNQSGDQLLRLALGSNCNNTASYHLVCTTGGSDRLFIYGNGNVVNSNNSYGSLSDLKLKENIVDATPKLDKLNQVRVVNYNLIGDEQKQLGVIAQELEQIFPGMIDESPDRDAEGNDLGTTTKSVKYSVFVPMLIKALQEQQQMIETLQAKVAALEAK